MLYLLVLFALLCSHNVLATDPQSTAPTVTLDDAIFIGASDGSTNKFLGIPYARPPIGELRLNHPQPNLPYEGTHLASEFGPSCPQQNIVLPSEFPPTLDLDVTVRMLNVIYNLSSPQAEDCLSLNVWTPPNVQPGSKLPVAVWIHGGGFEVGSSVLYDGGVIVERSLHLGEPVIFVSINYRLSALGWLPGKEAQETKVGNLGHRDQRQALRWIQKYIYAFGGDPGKVTIWGESAGAMSAIAQMTYNAGNTEGLFRGAYVESGSILPMGDMESGQFHYDKLVADTGCKGATDTLACLRHIPYDRFKAAMDASPSFLAYQSVALAWGPRTDGDFFEDAHDALVEKGVLADVPVVVASCDDEGTPFALSSLNISTTTELEAYLTTNFFPNASQSEIDRLLAAYPADPVQGAPFKTGNLNVVTPQNKRIAALLGDYVFETPRRLFLNATAGRSQDIWTSVTQRRKDLAVLGSAHITDLFDMFGPSDMTDHLIHFVNYLDPNGLVHPSLDFPAETQATFHPHRGVVWPKYDAHSRLKLAYLDGSTPTAIVHDTEREAQVRIMAEFWRKHKL